MTRAHARHDLSYHTPSLPACHLASPPHTAVVATWGNAANNALPSHALRERGMGKGRALRCKWPKRTLGVPAAAARGYEQE